MPLGFGLIGGEIYVAFLAQNKLGAVPKALGVKAVVVDDYVFDYVVFAEQIVGDDDFALQMLVDESLREAGIYALESIEKVAPAKGEFIDYLVASDEVMVAHHFDEC